MTARGPGQKLRAAAVSCRRRLLACATARMVRVCAAAGDQWLRQCDRFPPAQPGCKPAVIISTLDEGLRTISFSVNGQTEKVEFQGVPQGLQPAVCLCFPGESLRFG